MKKICLDNIVFSLQKTGGVSIVWYELLKRLLQSEYGDELFFIEYDNAGANIFRQKLSLPPSNVMMHNSHALSFQRYLSPRICNNERFLFHSSYYRTCPNPHAVNITTVHDFTYEHYVKGLRKQVHVWQKHNAIRHSDYIICVSQNTKKDLLELLPDVDEKNVTVIYNGVSEEYRHLDSYDETLLPYEKHAYVLFVGSRAPYKNFPLCVSALKDIDLKLVIVGNELSEQEKQMLEENVKGRYYYAGRITNERLNLFYNGAYCLMYPSAYEGFGIPVVEAQRAECPVIAMNSSSIPEVMGDTSFLLNECTTGEIQNRLEQLCDKNIRERLIDKGKEKARLFTWNAMFEGVKELYDNALL